MSPTCPNCGKPVPPSALQGLCPECMLALGAAAQTDTGGEAGPHGTKAAPSPPAKPEDIGKHFPQLEILECLGRGGMGVVYKARQPRLDRLVALKILAPEKEQDPKFAERFAREAKALARLNHPNIVTVHDFGEADGMFYLLMEYVDGVTLRQLLQTRKIAPEEALSIVPKICDALQFAHELGVVHRDIKPENVLLDKQGRVKIADFGIAKIMGAGGRAGSPLPAEATQPEGGAQGTARPSLPFTQDQVVGTPNYMAPEQVEKPQTVDHRADIYSLGVVFYEMLTGELPLGKFAPPSRKVQVDVRLDEVVLHALEKEPERRYQQASEVKTAVETIAHTQGDIPAGTAALKTEPHFSRTAVVGACWSVFGILAALFGLIARTEGGPGQTPTSLGLFLLVTLVPLGVTSLFGTTILGWVAVSQIRRSAGRLYGLGLAMFDGLFFPLLALIALLWFLWYGLLDWGFPLLQMLRVRQPSVAFSLILWLPWFAGSVSLCVWAAKRAGRAVSRLAGASAPVPASAAERLLWEVAAATVVVLLCVTVWVYWAQRPRLLGQTYVSDSPDGRYSALAQTFHEMRVFGGDKTYYRFSVQGLGGAVFEQWKVPVPVGKLATNYVAMSVDEIVFDATNRASIHWSEDSQRVSFSVRDTEVFAFNVATRSISSQEGFLPQRKTQGEAPAMSATGTLGPLPADPSKWVIRADVNEADIVQVEVGRSVAFTVDAFPRRRFEGKVIQVADKPVTIEDVVTYGVVIQVDKPEPRFKPGMTAYVAFPTSGGDSVTGATRLAHEIATVPPGSAPATLKRFTPADRPISGDLVLTGGSAWAVSCTSTQTFRLFEVPNPGVEQCTLTYRARLKTEGLVGRAYLEMWCQFPGRGEFFSRGLDNVVTGSNDWSTCQTSFFLNAGEKPDLVRLNLVVEGRGKVLIKDVALTTAPSR